MERTYKIKTRIDELVLDEAGSYQDIESVRKDFVNADDIGETYIKIWHEGNTEIVEFRPLFELPESYFWDLIQGETFGSPPETNGFLTNLKKRAPFDRIVLILGHLVEINQIQKIYNRANAIVNNEIHELRISNKSHNDKSMKLDDLYCYKNKCETFLHEYYTNIDNELQTSIQVFKSINLLNSVEYLVDANMPIINQNDDCLMLSPILFNFEQWKQMVKRELYLIEHPKLINSYVQKFIYLIKELNKRTSYNRFPTIESYFFGYSSTYGESYQSTFNAYLGIDKYNNKISDYLDFLSSISLDNIKEENRQHLAAKIIEDEKRKESVLQKIKNSRIEIFRNKNQIKKGFKYLLSKSNAGIDLNILDKVSGKIMTELFHYTSKTDEFIIPSTITFGNQLLLEYLIFLEKKGYIKYNFRISVPKVISQNCSLKIKGMTQSNLYHILKSKLAYHPDNVQDIKLTFEGLTSEIALVNEMKN
ncbi:hypothetical protein [Arenibacter certesii]|uniref:Uncharacterized protein n=1 Tax=Arenibacter certesii TaxID=228955 RepID=A0A918J235_9FLAO|nr:hypothetical protein [Arenibacter certesii]GGW43888.1 hypothetical protein GCM10007383_30540 [Arenibacter certesii]